MLRRLGRRCRGGPPCLTRFSDAPFSHAHTLGNLREEETLSTQLHNLLKSVLSLAAMGLIFAFHLLWRLLLPGLGVRQGMGGCSGELWEQFLLPLTNLGTATGKHLFEGIGQIAHEMKPVGNLPCLGCGFSRGSSVIGSSITTNQVHSGMVSQPAGKGFPF